MRVLMLCLLLLMSALPARAVSLLRDPDIEQALAQLAAPILRAAGLSPAQVEVRLIDAPSLNAFVVGPRAIYVHSGLVMRLESAAQLQAVLAHEAAHIANGHISRRITNSAGASRATLAGIAVATAVALSGNPKAAGAVALGASSSAQRSFLAHTRAEETAADQTAIRTMSRAGVDPRAAAEVLRMFQGQEALSVGRQDVYVRSHPLTRDRVRTVEALAGAAPEVEANPTAEYWFRRAQGKLAAFKRPPTRVLRDIGNRSDDVATMMRAVALHRQPRPDQAVAQMGALVAAAPKDAYYAELYGQILLESGRPREAVAAYGRAAQLAPRNALILGGHGRALLAAGDTRGALRALEQANARDGQDLRVLRDLARAYAGAGRGGEAALVTAERYLILGRPKDAETQARRALSAVREGSPSWQRAQDVIAATQTLNRR